MLFGLRPLFSFAVICPTSSDVICYALFSCY